MAKEKALIFISTSKKKAARAHSSGFSLLEILVALGLMSLVLTMATSFNLTQRQALDEVLEDIERAVRFSIGEAALRNAMVRLHFDLDKEPQQWAVEYGPDGHFVLPTLKFDSVVQSLEEEEAFQETVKKLNRKFNKVREFQDSNKEIAEGITIVGIGADQDERMVTEFQSSIYIYPSGEKDGAIVFLATEDEVASVSINPFTMDMIRDYRELPEGDSEDLGERQFELAKEMYLEWAKGK